MITKTAINTTLSLFTIIIIAIICFCGCASETEIKEQEIKNEKQYREKCFDQLMEIPDEYIYEYLIDEEIYPNWGLIFDEISSQCPEQYQALFDLADAIGYYPSSILGECCLDASNKTIHLTNNVLEELVDFEDMGFPFEYTEYTLKKKIEDGHPYFKDFVFCEKCFPVN